MPVLRSIRERFAQERPLDGVRIAACLHVTAETANLMRTLVAGGAEAALCASNPLSTQDEVAAALVARHDVEVHALRGEDLDRYAAHVAALVDTAPQITLDDGADLVSFIHVARPELLEGMLGATEETTTGLVRLRALEAEGKLGCPVIAVNEARTERIFNDHYGTGQSALDGILRATNLLLAGRTVVVLGYGTTGKGVAHRARGAGAKVVICEIDPVTALEARMEGFDVMPALEAAERGEIFITVTGARDALGREHFERMRDGAVLANAGHFDVEIDLVAPSRARGHRAPRGAPARRAVRPRRTPPQPARQRAGGQPRRGRGPPGGRHGHVLRAARARGRGPRAPRRRAAQAGPRGRRRHRRGDRAAQARVARRARSTR